MFGGNAPSILLIEQHRRGDNDMNPQVAWNEMLDAYRARNPDEVRECAERLQQWLNKGGFPPDTGGGSALGDEWHRCLAIAGVTFALQYAAVWKEE